MLLWQGCEEKMTVRKGVWLQEDIPQKNALGYQKKEFEVAFSRKVRQTAQVSRSSFEWEGVWRTDYPTKNHELKVWDFQ